MGWMRIGLFIVLTLVATTLPATASPSATATPTKASSLPAKPADNTGLVIHAAPYADVWTSPTTRPPIGDTHLYAVATLTAAPLHIRPWPIAGQACHFDAKTIHEQTRAGLVCRYPNAPPAGL